MASVPDAVQELLDCFSKGFTSSVWQRFAGLLTAADSLVSWPIPGLFQFWSLRVFSSPLVESCVGETAGFRVGRTFCCPGCSGADRRWYGQPAPRRQRSGQGLSP